MNLDSVPILALFASAIMIVMISIEGGYSLGPIFHRRSKQEKESPVSAVAGAVLALVAFMLAFTFGIAANRFDARKELVREEANKIRNCLAAKRLFAGTRSRSSQVSHTRVSGRSCRCGSVR